MCCLCSFIKFAVKNREKKNVTSICYPCRQCCNIKTIYGSSNIKTHLICYEFKELYIHTLDMAW